MNHEIEIKNFINSIHSLNESSWIKLIQLWELKKYDRKETITYEGEVEKYLYFVVEGIQRGVLNKKQQRIYNFFKFQSFIL